jgi:hypothetical protein
MRFYFHFTSKDWTVPVDEIAEHKELESWLINGAYVIRCHMEFNDEVFHLDVRFSDGRYLTLNASDKLGYVGGWLETPLTEVDPTRPQVRKRTDQVWLTASRVWSRVEDNVPVIRVIKDELANLLQTNQM